MSVDKEKRSSVGWQKLGSERGTALFNVRGYNGVERDRRTAECIVQINIYGGLNRVDVEKTIRDVWDSPHLPPCRVRPDRFEVIEHG